MNFTPINRFNDLNYFRIDILPRDQQEPFKKWIFRQPCPVILTKIDAKDNSAACVCTWDFARWFSEEKLALLADPYNS